MKRLIVCAMVILLATPVAANATGGIATTSHDFTTYIGNSVAVGLCTFCHTPHKAYQTSLLWNHSPSLNPSFSWSDATKTVGGTTLPADIATWAGNTKLCLSCHDGSVAIGDIAWFDEASHTGGSAINTLKHTPPDAFNVGFGGVMNGNHPVAVPYPFNFSPGTYNSITTGSDVLMSEFVGDPTANGIRLFHDTAGVVTAGAVAGSTGMECSSCHDPHNGPTAIGDKFLRGNLTGNDANYICLKCHIK